MQGADFFRALTRNGSAPALICGSLVFSHAELGAAADAFAARLPQARGLVFVHCANDVASVVAYLGALRAGHAVYLHGENDQRRLDALADRYRPAALCHGDEVALRADPCADLHPDLRVLLSTSGSTGSPRLVMLSERNLASNAAAIVEYLGLTAADRAITALKFHYSYGLSVLHSHLAAGGALVLTEEPVTAPAFWQAFRDGGATTLAGVPYTFELLANDLEWAATPGLRLVTQAGGRLAPDMVTRLARLGHGHGWQFVVMYGQTEAAPRIAWLPPELAEQHPDCIGVAIPGGHIAVLDEQGQELAPGRPGQLAYRGPNVMMGYALSAADLAHDRTPAVLLTGDIAQQTADGLFRIVGRDARIVKPFGLRLNLDEVETIAREQIPGAVATGNDERVVIGYPFQGTPPPPNASGDIARALGLPPHLVQLVRFDTMPQLANGKPDYRAIMTTAQGDLGPGTYRAWLPAAWDTLLSPVFYRRAVLEAGSILGLVRQQHDGVVEIYAAMTGRRPASDADDFRSLAGDSLTFVQTGLALEEYLGFLPDGWENMPIAELEALRDDETVI